MPGEGPGHGVEVRGRDGHPQQGVRARLEQPLVDPHVEEDRTRGRRRGGRVWHVRL
uniref:hypothetical protein n=1 Tax=Saccharothrix mutabilis TaxID=33921 RepID=UPI0031DBA312